MKKELKYQMIRTYSAGVFAGYVKKLWVENGLRLAVVEKARRIWYWSGAASLSQLAMEGTKDPQNCKFPCEVDRVELSNVVEILDITPAAKKSIKGVPVWQK